MRCLTSIRFNMTATVLNSYGINAYKPEDEGTVEDALTGGHFETIQDPDTNAITRVWVADVAPATPRPPRPGQLPAPETDYIDRFDIPCFARGFTELGFRSSANREVFENGVYMATEVIQMTYPAQYSLNRRQFVTNIRGRDDRPLWIEEELGQPTVFEVQGVTPSFDPFGRHVDNTAVLLRSSVQ